MVERIKEILSIVHDNKDSLLKIYIEQVKNEIELYTMREYDASMDVLAIQMVVEKYNKRFNEGMLSTSTSGVSTSFKDGYSQMVMNQLNSLRKKVKML